MHVQGLGSRGGKGGNPGSTLEQAARAGGMGSFCTDQCQHVLTPAPPLVFSLSVLPRPTPHPLPRTPTLSKHGQGEKLGEARGGRGRRRSSWGATAGDDIFRVCRRGKQIYPIASIDAGGLVLRAVP